MRGWPPGQRLGRLVGWWARDRPPHPAPPHPTPLHPAPPDTDGGGFTVISKEAKMLTVCPCPCLALIAPSFFRVIMQLPLLLLSHSFRVSPSILFLLPVIPCPESNQAVSRVRESRVHWPAARPRWPMPFGRCPAPPRPSPPLPAPRSCTAWPGQPTRSEHAAPRHATSSSNHTPSTRHTGPASDRTFS